MGNLKDVPGYEGLYKLRKDGMVLSLKRKVKNTWSHSAGTMQPVGGTWLRFKMHSRKAYVTLSYPREGERLVSVTKLVKAVCGIDIPEPQRKPDVAPLSFATPPRNRISFWDVWQTPEFVPMGEPLPWETL